MTTNTKGWFIGETVYSPQHQSPFFMHIKSNERINTLEEHTPETSFKPPPIGYGAPKFVDQHFSFNLLHICIHRLKFNFLRTENLNFFLPRSGFGSAIPDHKTMVVIIRGFAKTPGLSNNNNRRLNKRLNIKEGRWK